jgi:SsrA-binding protein
MINRKAKFEYHILEEYLSGIVLTGPEIKSLRNNLSNINEAYCVFIDGELYIRNMYIGKYDHDFSSTQEFRRDRKLLLTKQELKRLNNKLIDKGITIIPLSVSVQKYAKIKIGLAKGKNNYDKKMTIKIRDLDRELRCG